MLIAVSHHRKASTVTLIDELLCAAGTALRTLSGSSHAARPYPAPSATPTATSAATPAASAAPAGSPPQELNDAQRRLSGALMRVNHVGEVCAQALYSAQALVTKDPALKRQFEAAGREETDHLAWTQQRLKELGARPSLLNPLWYAGSFGIGLLAARAGDPISLGFLVETETQVERHLESHLDRLPAEDIASRAIVAQMKADEARHAHEATQSGAATLPAPVQAAMRAAAGLMTRTAHVI